MANKDEVEIPDFVHFTKAHHHAPYPFISPTRPELSVAGKNVVVTGGGTGIGKAIAIAFGQAGAQSVAILGRRIDRLQTAAAEIVAAGPSTRVLYETADLSQREAVDNALKRITDQELTRGFEINVVGAFNAVQAFAPLAAPGATLVNISSGIAHFAPMPGMFAYAATKAAIIKMFDYVAVENPGLHVVHVQPGVVSTEINADSSMVGQDEPELPAAFVVWLASPEAKFLKGKFVWVNWDAEELISRAKEIENSMLLKVHLDGVPM